MTGSKLETTPDDLYWMQLVKELPCILCKCKPPSQAHHVLDQGTRIGHKMTIPLCEACHIGANGVHGANVFVRVTKTTELQLVDQTIENVMKSLLLPMIPY